MAMNKYMHPRNPYKKPPDFLQLTLDYPDLRKYVKPDLSGKIKMNFKREGAVRELTKCLLHKDFGLSIDLPPDRLVPTLPLRMNYLLWIEDLLNESGKHFHGFDIGTGASCIYPLLAAKHFNWKMTATEIDDESTAYALKNVENNGLKDLVSVKQVNDSVMLDGALENEVIYDFCMCNPPFYSDESELAGKARTDRRAPPRNHPSGRNFELVAPGGETAFVFRIIQDSVKLRSKIRVYTVMVGHKNNLIKLKETVKQTNPVKMRTTEFCQGRTTRWGLAWTFSDENNLISTAVQPRKEQTKPPFRWIYPGRCSVEILRNQVINLLNNLQITVDEIENDDGTCDLCLKADRNTWTHSRRKRREEHRKIVENKVVSPCDSVVSSNSVEANNASNPPSPVDSLGYISCNESEERTEFLSCSSSSKKVSRDNKRSVQEPSSHCREDASEKTKSHIDDRLNSIRNDDIKSNDNVQILNLTNKKRRFEEPSSSTHTHQSEQSPSKKDNLPDNLKDPTSEILSDSETSCKKRKLDRRSHCSKIAKHCERPFVEAILVLSEFDEDIIFSLSFVDGTGGREAANQIFQYLKNKLSS